MAHVAAYKQRIVKEIAQLMQEYPVIGAVDMENLPAPQLQNMRRQLRSKVVLRMAKRRLIALAISQAKIAGIEKLQAYLTGMPALLFTAEDPFKLNKILQKNKSKAPAKPGQSAPRDIMITAGPTPFTPGPVIGELGKLGIKTGVEAGKVVIKEDKLLVKEGQKVSQEAASLLQRLDIKPMEIGLNVVAVLENGELILKSVLTIDEQQYAADVQSAAVWAYALATEIAYPTADTIALLITKAFLQAKALAIGNNIMSDVLASELLTKAGQEALGIKEAAHIEADMSMPEQPQKRQEAGEEIPPKEEKLPEVKQRAPRVDHPETDAKVAEMVRKTQEFATGRKVTTRDILAENELVEEQRKRRQV
ncbi:50S ribosomal protein L10 [Candidatus Woesearchaeota archaeon]|nr:50S ribosomal protein L10 [Candidatus Woesearchaeota archaeon]